MKKFSFLAACIVTTIFFLLPPKAAQSQTGEWKPSGPIVLTVGYGPGGGFDNWARAVSMVLPQYVGVPVVVKNVPGLAGVTAMEALWRAKPDGRTLILFEGGANLISQHILKTKYNIQKLTLIGTVQVVPFSLFVAKSSPFNSLQDLVAAGKKRPLKGGTTGLSSGLWLSTAVFADEAGIDIRPVPGYKSGGDLMVALEAGDTDLQFVPTQTAYTSLQRGVVKALAQGSPKDARLPADIPAYGDAGFPKTGDFATVIRGLAAPPETPAPAAAFLEKAFLNAMNDQKFQDWLKSQNDSVEPLNAKQTKELFRKTDETLVGLLPVLRQYVK